MELSSNIQNALMFMIADLVTGSDGVLLTNPRAAMAAQFETPAKALKAAKQIQWSVLEFAGHRPDCGSAAAIVIHGEAERELIEGRDSAGASAPGRSLLQYAQPTQILMTQGAYEKLREMPGLRFRPVTPTGTPGSDLVIRGQELIWRTPETLVRSSEVLPQATQIFAHNSEPLPVKVLPMPESILAHTDAIEEAMPDSASHELHVDSFRSVFPPAAGALDQREDVSEQEMLGSDSRTEGEQPVDLRSPLLKRSLAVASGVVLLSAVFGMIAYFRKPPAVNHAPNVTHTTTVEQPAPTPSTPQPDKTDPSIGTGEQGSSNQLETKADTAKPKSSRGKLHPVGQDPANPLPEGKQAPPRKGSPDFTEKDIPALLRKAESDAGAGNYPDARREYEVVLQVDPNNATAKQGLRRLNLIQR
jgi:hypothetical protein